MSADDPFADGGGDDDLNDLLADLGDSEKSPPPAKGSAATGAAPPGNVAPAPSASEMPTAELAPIADQEMLNYIDDFVQHKGETDVFKQEAVPTGDQDVTAVHHDEWLEVGGALPRLGPWFGSPFLAR